jgi:hypothetical protein
VTDYRVRRFIRPILMRDPRVWEQENPKQPETGQKPPAPTPKAQVSRRSRRGLRAARTIKAQP